jgi:hypothetical protein
LETIVSEISQRKKLVVLEGGYVTTPEFINDTVLQTKDYLRNLGRNLKLKNRSEPVAASKMSEDTVSRYTEPIFQGTQICILFRLLKPLRVQDALITLPKKLFHLQEQRL